MNGGGALLGSLLPILLSAAVSFPDYPVRPAGEYPISASKAGLSIAAHPLDAIREQTTYLRTKLTPKGYLPVFIVMQNASAEDTFLVQKGAITYRLLGTTGSGDTTPAVRSKTGEVLVIGGNVAFGALDVGLALAGLPMFQGSPLDLVAVRPISKATEVQQNLVRKALQSKTLSPGTSAHGFLYLPVPKGSARQKVQLRIPVTRPGSNEILFFDLVF